jgi:hypothetical protein
MSVECMLPETPAHTYALRRRSRSNVRRIHVLITPAEEEEETQRRWSASYQYVPLP